MEADSTAITQRSNISGVLWSNAAQVGCTMNLFTRKIENTSL